MKRFAAAFLAALLLVLSVSGCSQEDEIKLEGIELSLEASSVFFNTLGEHVLSYTLERAVRADSGEITFVHAFTNLSDYRITQIVCEFLYYSSDGSLMAHKQLTRLLNETPIEPGGTYRYYSTNDFSGATPGYMEANITRADTEFETPILPVPQTGGAFFDFFTDGRYTGLVRAFSTIPPVLLRYSENGGSEITVMDSASIKAVYEALKTVQVGDATDAEASGINRLYTFVTNDGEEYTVSFESGGRIRYGNESYETQGTEVLFAIKLSAGEYSQQSGDDYERGYGEIDPDA